MFILYKYEGGEFVDVREADIHRLSLIKSYLKECGYKEGFTDYGTPTIYNEVDGVKQTEFIIHMVGEGVDN